MSGNLLRTMITWVARLGAVGLPVVAIAVVLGALCLGDAANSAPAGEDFASTASLSEGLPHEAVIFHGDAAFSGVEEEETSTRSFGLGTRARAAECPTVWMPQPAPRLRAASGCRRYYLRI